VKGQPTKKAYFPAPRKEAQCYILGHHQAIEFQGMLNVLHQNPPHELIYFMVILTQQVSLILTSILLYISSSTLRSSLVSLYASTVFIACSCHKTALAHEQYIHVQGRWETAILGGVTHDI
jgi:hypothetical protein